MTTNYYSELIGGVAYWLAVLNEAELLVGEELPDQSIYLGDIPVKLCGDSGDVVGYLVDEIGGVWSWRPTEST